LMVGLTNGAERWNMSASVRSLPFAQALKRMFHQIEKRHMTFKIFDLAGRACTPYCGVWPNRRRCHPESARTMRSKGGPRRSFRAGTGRGADCLARIIRRGRSGHRSAMTLPSEVCQGDTLERELQTVFRPVSQPQGFGFSPVTGNPRKKRFWDELKMQSSRKKFWGIGMFRAKAEF
jgi:hypothetical protein